MHTDDVQKQMPLCDAPTFSSELAGCRPPVGERLFTIGHSNHEWRKFIELLRQARVTALADVRSTPCSQRYPQFNRRELEQGLKDEDIVYVFLGDAFGGRAFVELSGLFALGFGILWSAPILSRWRWGVISATIAFNAVLMALYITRRIPRQDYLF